MKVHLTAQAQSSLLKIPAIKANKSPNNRQVIHILLKKFYIENLVICEELEKFLVNSLYADFAKNIYQKLQFLIKVNFLENHNFQLVIVHESS